MFLVQGSIFLKGPIPLFLSVTALGKLLIRAILHVIYVSRTLVMIVNEAEYQSPITVLLRWLEVRAYVRYLEYSNHLFINQRSVGNEIVGEWTYFFRVSSKHRSPTEN